MLNSLKTHRRWFIPTGVAAVLVSLLFAVTLHLQQKRQEVVRNAPGNSAGIIPEDRISAFSVEPAPAELPGKLEAMDSYQRKMEKVKLANLQVIWPLYFFSSTRHGEDMVSVLMDASESGFGVIIKTEISPKRYPGITSGRLGDRIWLAGKITEVDTHGTGQITLTTKFAGFADRSNERPGTKINHPE